MEAFRERAALIGADAVLGIEFHHEDDHPDDKGIATHLSDLVVRFGPVLQDRRYDVLGRLQAAT
jgi:hypothetical protein